MIIQLNHFAWYINIKSDKTGDGTTFNIVFDTIGVNIGSCYNSTNGRFTAAIKIAGLQSNHTYSYLQFQVDGGATRLFYGESLCN